MKKKEEIERDPLSHFLLEEVIIYSDFNSFYVIHVLESNNIFADKNLRILH